MESLIKVICPLTAKTPGTSILSVVFDPEEMAKLTTLNQFGIDEHNNLYSFNGKEWEEEKGSFIPLTGELFSEKLIIAEIRKKETESKMTICYEFYKYGMTFYKGILNGKKCYWQKNIFAPNGIQEVPEHVIELMR